MIIINYRWFSTSVSDGGSQLCKHGSQPVILIFVFMGKWTDSWPFYHRWMRWMAGGRGDSGVWGQGSFCSNSCKAVLIKSTKWTLSSNIRRMRQILWCQAWEITMYRKAECGRYRQHHRDISKPCRDVHKEAHPMDHWMCGSPSLISLFPPLFTHLM